MTDRTDEHSNILYTERYEQAASARQILPGDLHARDDIGQSMLHYASRRGDVPFATLLLQAGADVNAVDLAGRTPLHEAVEDQDVEMMNILIDHGANIEAADSRSVTPLILAASRRGVEHLRAANLLLDRGATLDPFSAYIMDDTRGARFLRDLFQERRESLRNNPHLTEWFDLAYSRRDLRWIKRLLDLGIEVEGRFGGGATYLWRACKYKSPIEVIDILLKYGADPHEVDPDSGRSPIEIAADVGYSQAVRRMRGSKR